MNTDDSFKSEKVECKTQGHAGCRKTYRKHKGHWKLDSIVHYVYGTRRIENVPHTNWF